jgi:hypothetical protein
MPTSSTHCVVVVFYGFLQGLLLLNDGSVFHTHLSSTYCTVVSISHLRPNKLSRRDNISISGSFLASRRSLHTVESRKRSDYL